MPASESRRFSDLRFVGLTDCVIWQVYIVSPPTDRLTPATASLTETFLDAAARAHKQ
jgi:hypothetical protein